MANQTELLNVSDEMKLDDDRQNFCEELGAEELCSSSLDTFEELYSSSATDAVRIPSNLMGVLSQILSNRSQDILNIISDELVGVASVV